MTSGERVFHEIAGIFPLMQGEEYEALKADIAAHGLREPIWLHPDGRIIDGRNRYRACLETDVAPRFRTWDGRGSLVAFVVSLNLHRRHLSSSQRAALAIEILPLLESEARERMQAGGQVRQQGQERIPYPEEQQGQARDQAAALTGTNGRYVSDAKHLKRAAPQVFARVVDGTMSLPEAKKLSRLLQPVQDVVLQKIEDGEARTVKEAHRQVKDAALAKAMANPTRSVQGDCTIVIGDARCLDLGLFDERYAVIIADPPWPYDNPKNHDPRMGGYTYQPMTMGEIQVLPVGELAAKDAVLFLWGTWPKLPQVVETMRVWGFEHVTGFPWVKTTRDGKPLYGIGSWVAGCSEYVLIGRRGNVSPPDVDKYLGLVGPSLGHSRKPDDVYAIAEALPGPYLELFARRTRPGWTVFGNEVEREQQVQS